MKVGLDALLLKDANTGIGNYIRRLISGFDEIIGQTGHSIDVYTGCSLPDRFCASENLQLVQFDVHSKLKRTFYRNYWLGHMVNRTDIHVFHGTSFYIPLGLRKPSVVTIHDLVAYKQPQTCKTMTRLYGSLFIPDSVHRADRIIAVSENTKRDIMQVFHVGEDRIRVVYEAAGKDFGFSGRDEIEAQKARFGLGRYILFVGTLEPRKNLGSLLEAYRRILPLLPGEYKLVITGQKGWMEEDMLKDSGVPHDRILLTGYVDNRTLRLLYNGSDVFVYPSLYEGFGLPVLEAMACGTPVISSNASSLPEVVGDAGITVSPHDCDAMARAILEVITNSDLSGRLVQRGIRRAGEFTWEKTALKTLEVYEELYRETAAKG